jgi:hypothetical protein
MQKTNKNQSVAYNPILKFRVLFGAVIVVMLLIAGPLMMVWKQVYINSSSLKLEKMADTLAILQRESAALEIKAEQLSNPMRIEKFAETVLHLEYPSSDRIEIVRFANDRTSRNPAVRFFAALRRSVLKDRG